MTPIALPLDPMDLRYLPDSAIGSDAKLLRRTLRGDMQSNTSIALQDAAERLDAALTDAADVSVRAGAITYARSFMSALPAAWQQSVDVQVEPAGEIIFEWMVSSRWILTLSINEQGRIAYSGIFGAARTKGKEPFDGSLPRPVALAIARLRDGPTPV
jgi:hypothetical protein